MNISMDFYSQLDNNQFASNATIPEAWGSIPTLLKL
jgi:hypothetical protein